MPEIAWVGCACDVIAWNAVRVTRASLDKQPHDVAAMFDQVAATEIGRSGWRSVEWCNLIAGIVALHRAIRPA
jgi:hypothetical protein